MPDDFTFDDDDLMPDEPRDEVDQPSGDDAESAPPGDVLPADDIPRSEPADTAPAPDSAAEDEHVDLDFLFDDDAEDTLIEVASAASAGDEPVDIDWLFDDADDDTGEESRESEPEVESVAAMDASDDTPDDDLVFDFEDEPDGRVTSDSAEDEPQKTVPEWVLAGYASAEEAAEAQRDEGEQTQPSSAAPEWLQPAIAAYEAGEDLVFDFDDEEDQSDRAEPKVVPEWVASAASAADDSDHTDDDLVFDFDDEPDEQAAVVPDWVAVAAVQAAEDDALEAEDDALEAIEEHDEDETVPDWAHADAEPEPERPVIRRIEVDDGARLPDWVRDPTAEPGEDIPEGLTYDEWEALMDERERAAQEPPAPAAPPDDMTQVAPPVPGMPEPPMPDFGAADSAAEPPADDVTIPDWAKATSFDADPFTQPFEIRASEPDTSAEPGDLPDWMTGDSAPDMDWNGLFGAPAPEPSEADDAEPQIKRIPTGDTGQLAAGVDADWLAEDDAGDDGGDDEHEIRTLDAMFAEPGDAPDDAGERDDDKALEPAEVPDWFAEMAPLADETGDDGGDGDDEIRSLDAMFAEPGDAPDDAGERDDDEALEPAEVPDWFAEMAPLADETGDDGGDDEIRSLDDMFAEPGDAPDDAGEREDEALEPAEVPDWFAEMAPLADDAGDDGGDDEIRSLDDMFAEPGDDGELESAELPDWLADTGIDDVVPGPEDIPFPDLELDDTMPQGAWEAFETRAQARADAEAASGDFVERFDPLEPDEFPAADEPEPAPPPRDEALPDWIIDSALPGDAGLPDDLSADGIWTMDMIPDQPIPGVAEDKLDWLDDISPDDVAAQGVGESLPPLPDIADIVPVEDEDDLLRAAPLDSSALDDLLSTSALTVHEPQVPARAGEPDVDFDALFNELPDDTDADVLFAEAGTTQLEAWFAGEADDAALLEAQAAEGRVDTTDEFAALLQDTAREAPDTETAEPSSRLGRFRLGRKRDKEPVAEEITATGATDQGDSALETPESLEAEPLTAEPQPEWVEELRPVDLPVTVKAGGVQADFKQKHIADLPDRLRAFREATLSELAPPDKLPPADEGPLAGIAGALPLPDVLLSGEGARVTAAGLVITAQQQARADRLQTLLDAVADDELERERDAAEASGLGLLAITEPDEQPQVVVAPKAPPPERRRKRRRLDRWLVMLIMLVALVGPFITDALHVADDAPALSGTRRQVASAVARVRPGDYVLFAFEYGPPTARELDALADAVLRDVLARRAIPITLSTNPAGALHAETVVTVLAEDSALLTARDDSESALIWGEDYVLLGYLPGEAVGVRALSAPQDELYAPHSVFDYDLRGDETGLPAIALDRDIALLVVIGDESDDVRTWVEQLSDVTVRKVALVTAAIEPLTTPYVHADGGYAGYLAGARDAYSYNAARNAGNRTPYAMPDNAPDIPNPEQSRWQSMALGALLAALVIGSGLFINLLRGLLRRRHG